MTPGSPVQPLRLAITGMSCAGCVAAVETALRGTPGVAEANVNFAERTAQVAGGAEAATLIQAVRAAGYDAAELRDAAAEAEHDAAEQAHYRRLVRNTVVAGTTNAANRASVWQPSLALAGATTTPPAAWPDHHTPVARQSL